MPDVPVERIKQFIDYKGINVSSFEKRIGYSNGAFASQLKSRRSIGIDKLENILNEFSDLDANWVLTGRGSMLKTDKSQSVENSTKIALNSTVLKTDEDMHAFLLQNNKGTRYFDNYARSGLISGINEGKTRPDAVIVIPGLTDCNFAINVYGDSMYPKFCSGEIVMCKEMIIDKQLTYIRYGEAYVVDLDDGVVLKYIKRCEDDEYLLFVSENELFEPYKVHKSRIRKMYLVKGVITRKNF